MNEVSFYSESQKIEWPSWKKNPSLFSPRAPTAHSHKSSYSPYTTAEPTALNNWYIVLYIWYLRTHTTHAGCFYSLSFQVNCPGLTHRLNLLNLCNDTIRQEGNGRFPSKQSPSLIKLGEAENPSAPCATVYCYCSLMVFGSLDRMCD